MPLLIKKYPTIIIINLKKCSNLPVIKIQPKKKKKTKINIKPGYYPIIICLFKFNGSFFFFSGS